MSTGIPWTDETWNPIVGCSVHSPGCAGCYAMRDAGGRLAGSRKYAGLTDSSKAGPVWNGGVRLWQGALDQPLRWSRPRRIFVNSMGDLFHENVPDEWIDRVFAVMALAPQHSFQVLTKRAERMREYLTARNGMGNASICRAINLIPAGTGNRHGALAMPLPNCWLGVSVEDQTRADERIPHLLRTPAAVRFVSAEPLLGPVIFRVPFPNGDPRNLHDALTGEPLIYGTGVNGNPDILVRCSSPKLGKIDWVIAGGESGPKARPMHPGWARSLRDQCQAAGVPFFFKQNGAFIALPEAFDHGVFGNQITRATSIELDGLDMIRIGKKAGRLLDGREWSEMPE